MFNSEYLSVGNHVVINMENIKAIGNVTELIEHKINPKLQVKMVKVGGRQRCRMPKVTTNPNSQFGEDILKDQVTFNQPDDVQADFDDTGYLAADSKMSSGAVSFGVSRDE